MNKGFTLIEFIIVIVILGIISMVGVGIIRQGAKAYIASADEKELQQLLRMGLERMAREIRELDNMSITNATSAEFSFTNPYNTVLTGVTNAVTFRLNGTTLERSGDNEASWQALVEDVTNDDIFTYYKIDAGLATEITTPVASPIEIEWVLVKLEVTRKGKTRTLRQQVLLRNVK